MEHLFIVILCLLGMILAFLLLSTHLYEQIKELEKVIAGLMEANSDYSEMVSYFENELNEIKEKEF